MINYEQIKEEIFSEFDIPLNVKINSLTNEIVDPGLNPLQLTQQQVQIVFSLHTIDQLYKRKKENSINKENDNN